MDVRLRSSSFINVGWQHFKIGAFHIKSEFVAFVERFATLGNVKDRSCFVVGPPLGDRSHLSGFADARLHLSGQPALPSVSPPVNYSENSAPQMHPATCQGCHSGQHREHFCRKLYVVLFSTLDFAC